MELCRFRSISEHVRCILVGEVSGPEIEDIVFRIFLFFFYFFASGTGVIIGSRLPSALLVVYLAPTAANEVRDQVMAFQMSLAFLLPYW